MLKQLHRYASAHSKLLTPKQNKGVINALSPNCTALVTTVSIMRVTDTSLLLFGVVTIELEAKINKYFFRFYNMDNMKLLIQREIKRSIGMPFTVVNTRFIQMEIDKIKLLFEFIDTFRDVRLSEFRELKRALRGELEGLVFNAQMRFFVDNRATLSEAMDNVFNRLLHRKTKYDWEKKRTLIIEAIDAKNAQYALTHWRTDSDIRDLFKVFGVNHEEVYKNRDCSLELEQMIAKYGGTDKFKQNTVQHGLGSGLDEISPASSTLSSVTSPESSTLSSVPKTPDKLVLERITAFDPAEQVEIPKNDDICKEKRREEEEEFVAPEVIPEKVAEPAAKEKVGKRFLPDAFVMDINMMFERISEKLRKRKSEKKLKKEQKAKKGQPISTTPEQTPEKEAPMPTEKTPVKEASKTPEKNPSSVSDSTDETESDSDDKSN